jgi:hypothetical protein
VTWLFGRYGTSTAAAKLSRIAVKSSEQLAGPRSVFQTGWECPSTCLCIIPGYHHEPVQGG